jgi:hypothetical protein
MNGEYSKILYENDDIFKNCFDKKGVETSKLSNFRATIPLTLPVRVPE